MKILRVTSLGYESGGAENGMVLLKPVLERMGHTVKVFSSDAGPKEGRFSDYECRALSSQPLLLRVLYRIFYPHAYFSLRRVLREYKPDIVQVHTLYELSPSVLFLLRKYPTVVTVHGAEEYLVHLMTWAFPKHFFKQGASEFVYDNLTTFGKAHHAFIQYVTAPVYHFALKHVDVFLVMSAYMQEELKKEGIRKSVCIPNATTLLPATPIDPAGRTLLYVGRLEKIKGVQYLIEALSEIREQYPETNLVVAGDGPYRMNLEGLVRGSELEDRVTFTGHVGREELIKCYVDSTVVCMPSVWPEPFGKVGVEAMSVGRPVIASAVGGIPEWLEDGRTGHLVPPSDAHVIAQKVCELFGNEVLLKRMSENAVAHAQKFSMERYASHIVSLFEALLKREEKKN